MRVLLTGVAGFTGRYVAAELVAAGHTVTGLVRPGARPDQPVPGVTPHEVDLLDRTGLRAAVAAAAPDAVVHLAAIAFVAHGDADELYRVNVVGTRNLLDALDSGPTPGIVVLASSANIYGNAAVEPIDEDVAPAPANDYAVSKLAMEHLARLWADRLPIAVTRPFNYTGAGQDTRFLLPKIVDHFRRGEREIELGNTRVWRDFGDVRSVARYYRRLVELAPAGLTVNLCSGVGHSLAEVLDLMAAIAGYRIEVRVNPAFVRRGEVVRLVGSRRRLVEALGDEPVIPLAETLGWMYALRR